MASKKAPHPITLVRRQATSSGQGSVLLEPVSALAPRVLPYSRRAARLLERLGLERPGLRLSGLLAELGAPGHRGIPAVLVDKLAVALGSLLAGTPPPAPKPPAQLQRLLEALADLEKRTRAEDPRAAAKPQIARLTLDESPPAFFYGEGRGLDSVPSGIAVLLGSLQKRPLSFATVRGPMLDVSTRLYALERIKDIVLEPIADEASRVLAMLASGTICKVALLDGGGIRVTLRDEPLALEVGLDSSDRDLGEPGRYVVHGAARAKDIIAALAAREDVTIAWSSAKRFDTARVKASELRVRLGEKRDWLGLEGGVSLEETDVSVQDLLRALREGRRYTIVTRGDGADDLLVAIDDALAQALAPLAASSSSASLLALVDAGAVIEDSPLWRSARADLERSRVVDGAPAPSLRAELRPYQRDGLRFLRRLALWGTGGVLADDMGLGKTVQAIALLVDRAAALALPQLVVAPTSVCFNWRDELQRFAPHLHVVTDPKAAVRAGQVCVTSYTRLLRSGAPGAWGTLVLDEAQNVKNAGTQRAKAVRAVDARFRIALTGTPIENHTGELWAIFDAVAPGLFGTWTEWKARFATPIEKDADVRRRKTLARAIAPFVLRRKKRDVAPELPPRTDVVHHLVLDADERKAYERVQQALLLDILRDKDEQRELSAAERRVKILAAITRLRLVACHKSFGDDVAKAPAEEQPGSKQRAMVDLLLELREEGHKALVFSQFVRHLELARAAATAAGVTSLQLDGRTPADERQRLVGEFQAGGADAFFISMKAGGTGLNLTAASYVIHLDPWWNPAVEDQASDRAHRIGQTLPVTVARLVAEDTVEEQMLELHEQKRALVEGVLEGTAQASSLSADELLTIVQHTRRTARDADLVQEYALPDDGS